MSTFISNRNKWQEIAKWKNHNESSSVVFVETECVRGWGENLQSFFFCCVTSITRNAYFIADFDGSAMHPKPVCSPVLSIFLFAFTLLCTHCMECTARLFSILGCYRLATLLLALAIQVILSMHMVCVMCFLSCWLCTVLFFFRFEQKLW